MYKNMLIFSGTAHPKLTQDICDHLGKRQASSSAEYFPDGELNLKVNEDVRGSDVYIIQPTCPPVDSNLMELLVMIDCMVRASAGRVTAVIPYYGYARKDRKDEGRVPITAKLVANMIAKAGANRVITIDLHAAQIQGFFDIPVDHLYASPALLPYLRGLELPDLVVVGPDVGSIKLARAFAKRLGGCEFAIVDKRRDGDKIEVTNVIGNVKGKNVILVDDMISTGGSISKAAQLLKEEGAKQIHISTTHPVLCGPALERLDMAPVEQVVVTDTIPLDGKVSDKLHVVSIAPLLAKAIDHIHRNESVSGLFEGWLPK